jgi:hypothetical protein
METHFDFGTSLYDCATICAIKRQKRRCKERFGSKVCYYCKFYIDKYVDADPRYMNLYMLQAEKQAISIRSVNNSHHISFWIGILLCLYLG